jgi:hypothetical protein
VRQALGRCWCSDRAIGVKRLPAVALPLTHLCRPPQPCVRGLERRRRPRDGLARRGADRQGNVGGAGRDGQDAGREGGASERRSHDGVGAQPHRGHAARDPLPPGERHGPAEENRRRGQPGQRAHDPTASSDASWLRVERGGAAEGARQQLPGHLGVRGALGRSRHRVLQGARHQQRGTDGGQGHTADLLSGKPATSRPARCAICWQAGAP